VAKHCGRWKLVKQALGSLVGVGGKGRDIDEPLDTLISPCVRDQCAAIRVADEDCRAMDTSKTCFHGGDVGDE
jgi:hypothetical protein